MSKYRYAWARLLREARDLLEQETGDLRVAVRRMEKWIAAEKRGNPRLRQAQPLSRKRLHTETRRLVFERDGYRCRRCGDHKRLTIHHARALSRGGSHDPANLVTLCLPCHDLVEMRRELVDLLRSRCMMLVTLKGAPPPGPPIHERKGYSWRVRRAQARQDAAD